MELKSQVQAVQEFSRFGLSRTGPIIVPQELLQRLGIQDVLEKMCIPDRAEQFFLNRRPHPVEFNTSSRLKHDVQTKRLHKALKTEFCWTMLRGSTYFLANFFQVMVHL